MLDELEVVFDMVAGYYPKEASNDVRTGIRSSECEVDRIFHQMSGDMTVIINELEESRWSTLAKNLGNHFSELDGEMVGFWKNNSIAHELSRERPSRKEWGRKTQYQRDLSKSLTAILQDLKYLHNYQWRRAFGFMFVIMPPILYMTYIIIGWLMLLLIQMSLYIYSLI